MKQHSIGLKPRKPILIGGNRLLKVLDQLFLGHHAKLFRIIYCILDLFDLLEDFLFASLDGESLG